MRLDDLADDDVVISLLNNGCHTTFDRTGSIDENRRSRFALTEGLSTELAVAQVYRPKEGEGQILLFLAEHIEREGLRRLHSLVSTGIGLDTHDHEGRSECALSDPVERGRRNVSLGVVRREDIDAIRDHSQNGFLRVGVHALLLPSRSVDRALVQISTLSVALSPPNSAAGRKTELDQPASDFRVPAR